MVHHPSKRQLYHIQHPRQRGIFVPFVLFLTRRDALRYSHHLNIKQHPTLIEQKALWVRRHRGKLSRIAAEVGVTLSWVSMVLYGARSKNGRVERALGKAGAPGMKVTEKVTEEA